MKYLKVIKNTVTILKKIIYIILYMERFFCKYCNYSSDDISNFKKHLNSNKHKIKSGILQHVAVDLQENNKVFKKPKENEQIQQIPEQTGKKSKTMLCIYCKKIYNRANIARHHSTCKIKKQIDNAFDEKEKEDRYLENQNELKKLLKMNEKTYKNLLKIKEKEIKKLKKEKENEIKTLKMEKSNIETQYSEFVKQIALNNSTKGGTGIINNTINMVYVMNNFTKAFDFDETMKKPLTKAERARMLKLGPVYACSDLLLSRCIDNIPIEFRPFHCTDPSRQKFGFYKGQQWKIDCRGEYILEKMYDHMDDVFVKNFKGPIEEKVKYIKQLMDIKKKGPTRRKILNTVIASTMLSNVDMKTLRGIKK